MAKPIEALQAEVLGLPIAERALLLERLISSLDADPEIQEAWITEAARREVESQAGTVTSVSGDEALARIRKLLV